jgi:hypothetical protein
MSCTKGPPRAGYQELLACRRCCHVGEWLALTLNRVVNWLEPPTLVSGDSLILCVRTPLGVRLRLYGLRCDRPERSGEKAMADLVSMDSGRPVEASVAGEQRGKSWCNRGGEGLYGESV